MAVFMLTTENILKVEVIIHPGSSESATFRRSVQHSLGNSLAEQMLYLNDAVDAAKDCFSRRLTRDLNADLTFNFKSYFGSKLGELSAQSSSSGLAYGIAAVRSWLTILHQQMLFQSVRFPEVDLFVTGELTKDGQINRIGGLQKKIELLMQYQDQLSSDTRSPFYVLTPQANVDEYLDEQSQQQWVSNQQWIKDRGGVLLSFSSLPEFLEHICDGYLASEHFGQSYELPGLRPFSFAHRNMYFGRSSEIEVFSRDALEAFQEKKMFTVHGFSGAGKSSFLMAGVIPAILSKAEGRFRTFLPEIHILRPRDFPSVETLKQNILCQVFNLESWQAENGLNQMLPLSGQPDQIQAIYENYILHLSDDEIQALNKPLLLLIDQAEELYTIPTLQNEAASFCKWLAALSHYLPVNFLLSIRTEYQAQLNLQEISSYRELPVLSERAREEILESLSDLLRMNWSSDRTDYKEKVKERFLRDARTAPLPAIGYALQLMRDRSSLYPKDYKSHISGSLFTHEIYNQIGRIEGVISSQAEFAVNSVTNILFNHLKPDAQEEARDRLLHDLFCAFIGVSQDGHPVAQVVSKKSLIHYRDSALLERLIQEMMAYGLIIATTSDADGGLKLAHDALLPIKSENGSYTSLWLQSAIWYQKNTELIRWFFNIKSMYLRWLSQIEESDISQFFIENQKDLDDGVFFIGQNLIPSSQTRNYIEHSRIYKAENDLRISEEAREEAQLLAQFMSDLMMDFKPERLISPLLSSVLARVENRPEPVRNEIIDALNQVNPIDLMRFAMMEQVFVPAEERIEKQLSSKPLAQVVLRDSLSRLYFQWGEYDRAADYLEQNIAVYEQDLFRFRFEMLEAQHSLANLKIASAQYSEAISICELLIRVLTPHLEYDSLRMLTVKDTLAQAYYKKGDYAEARELQEFILSESEKLPIEAHQLMDRRFSLSNTLVRMNQFDDAWDLLEKILHWREQDEGVNGKNTLICKNSMAFVLMERGEVEKAYDLFSDIHYAFLRNIGEMHPDTLTLQDNMASCLLKLGKIDEAKGLLENNFLKREKKFGKNHPETLANMSKIAQALTKLGLFSKAVEILEEVVEIRAGLGDDFVKDLVISLTNLAYVESMNGDFKEAKKLYSLAIKILKEKFSNIDFDALNKASSGLARAYFSAGDFVEAKIEYEGLYDRLAGELGRFDENVLRIKASLINVYEKLNFIEPMIFSLREEVDLYEKELGSDHFVVKKMNLCLSETKS